MKSHRNEILDRIKRKAASPTHCDYRVVAIGVDHRGRIIGIADNRTRYTHKGGGWHAEERLMHSTPKSLKRIYIARVGKGGGELLPIEACQKCHKLARKFGVTIHGIEQLVAKSS